MGLENWAFEIPEELINITTKGPFRSDNGEAVRDACVDGLGITLNSKWIAYKHLESTNWYKF